MVRVSGQETGGNGKEGLGGAVLSPFTRKISRGDWGSQIKHPATIDV